MAAVGLAAARHHSSCRYPRSRWRHPASCDPFRDVPFLEKALCRWWLPGAGLSKGLGEDLATSSKLKSSSAPIGRKDSWCFHGVGSSNAPFLGSTAAEGLQRIGRTSIATRWRFCGLPQSASCSENFVIPPDVFGQTLRDSGIMWTAEALDTFIADPQASVPANRMPYAGMPDAAD